MFFNIRPSYRGDEQVHANADVVVKYNRPFIPSEDYLHLWNLLRIVHIGTRRPGIYHRTGESDMLCDPYGRFVTVLHACSYEVSSSTPLKSTCVYLRTIGGHLMSSDLKRIAAAWQTMNEIR